MSEQTNAQVNEQTGANAQMQETVLSVNTVKVAVIKATKATTEKNSKGESIVWHRLDSAIKESDEYINTSKNNVEYAAKMPMVDVSAGIQWLYDNQGLKNVQDWFTAKLIEVNRPILATAGAATQTECDLIADIQSLVAFDTLQSARGRKASSLNADQWKIYHPALALYLKAFFAEKKVNEEKIGALVNKYVHLVKGAVYHFSPIGDKSTMDKVQEMIDFVCEKVIVEKPEIESVAAFAVQVMQNNCEKYDVDGADEY